MSYQIVVCIKQVPDTENLTSEAMKDDGTVNRSALPAIVNPEDLNALELALSVKDRWGADVTVITMGPPSAAEALRQMLYRGADDVVLVTDRKFAAADTLATSYTLSRAIKSLPAPDLVMCGRQAIDGDTAQIGPQLADKLNLPQITYAAEILELNDGHIKARREFDLGYEIVRSPLPALLTVPDSANSPRPPSAKRLLSYRHMRAPGENNRNKSAPRVKGDAIKEWAAADIGCEPERCGISGSPTKVKKIDSVQLVSKDHVRIEPTEEALSELMKTLMQEHTIE